MKVLKPDRSPLMDLISRCKSNVLVEWHEDQLLPDFLRILKRFGPNDDVLNIAQARTLRRGDVLCISTTRRRREFLVVMQKPTHPRRVFVLRACGRQSPLSGRRGDLVSVVSNTSGLGLIKTMEILQGKARRRK